MNSSLKNGSLSAISGSVSRLPYLDSLRGIAIALVITQHIGEHTNHTVRDFTFQRLQLGQMGVAVFFMCSGFIIPVSLERAKSLSKFWIARVFRLYPIYLLVLLAYFVGLQMGEFHTDMPLRLSNWLMNITMFQEFFGFKHILGLTWTLHWEMVFYLSVSVLFIIKLLKHPVFLCLSLNATFVLGTVFVIAFTDAKALPPQWLALALMYLGTVYNSWVQNNTAPSWLLICIASSVFTIGVVFYTNMGLNGDLSDPKTGTGSFPVMFATYMVAMLIFGLIVMFGKSGRLIPFGSVLAKLGIISYSLYLVHALVIETFDYGMPGILEAIVSIAVSVVLASVTYRYIEKPAINLGRKAVNSFRLTNRNSDPVAQGLNAR